jgi:SAM-dependent methyltransferase
VVRELKNDTYLQPHNKPLFEIFASRLDAFDWTRANVLDYGCNVGNFYLDAAGRIPANRHIGVDILEASIALARQRHPDTRWIWLNRYHPSYNKHGVPDLALELDVKLDLIVAYSVFSHSDLDELRAALRSFEQLLNPGGTVLFSLWEDWHLPFWLDFLDEGGATARDEHPTDWTSRLYLVDRLGFIADGVLPAGHLDFLDVFYQRDFMLREFPGLTIPKGSAAAATNGFPLQTIYAWRKPGVERVAGI